MQRTINKKMAVSKTRTIIGKYRELYPEQKELSSMKGYFSDHPYPGQGKIIYFMMHAEPRLIGMCSCFDVFTGERISMSKVLMSYGDYEWWDELAHYVKNYNLRLPVEFEAYVLGLNLREVYENYRRRHHA